MKNYLLALLSLILISACCDAPTTQTQEQSGTETAKISEHLLHAVVWYEQSAENTACYLQAYNNAKKQLSSTLDTITASRPLAVIVDIDETILDNSPLEAYLIQNNKPYSSDAWNEWVNLVQAKALPGAKDFVQFAKDKGVQVFYVSNRKVENLQVTIDNLKKEGLPFAEEKYVLLQSTTSDKTERRQTIEKDYEIIMLIGDNLRDFDELFADRTDNFGKTTIENNSELFGTKYIILPNPMYGQWTKAYKSSEGETSNSQLLDNMRNKLTSF